MSTATPAPAHRRHDISDQAWETIAPHLSGGPGKVDASPRTTSVSATACSGSSAPAHPGATCPRITDTGTPPHTASGASRRAASGAKLLSAVSDDLDFEWLMIDASQVKVHQHGTGARGGNQAAGRPKGG